VASHELCTPCTSLRLGIEALLRHARAGSLAQAPGSLLERILEISDRQTRHLASLIERLLDVSRIEAGQLELAVSEVDLAAIAREISAEMSGDALRAGSPISVDAAGPVVGAWDKARLAQVMTNLLGNAIKYGGGEPIQVRVWSEGERARLAVEDRGIGVPEGKAAQIFERFERAVPARHYGGLGLGLYIVRQIVEAHGGAITLESAPGKGTTFSVDLPI
jgi:signal transduction histidine kinase